MRVYVERRNEVSLIGNDRRWGQGEYDRTENVFATVYDRHAPLLVLLLGPRYRELKNVEG